MSSIPRKNKYLAFTLIELLVVIAIIAILSTLSVITLSSARAKARDAKRLADIRNTQTALDLYYNEYGVYPVASTDTSTTNFCLSSIGISTTCGTIVYLAEMPTDPVSGFNYSYTPTSSLLSYVVAFTLTSGAGGYAAGNYTATPNGIAPWVCGDSVSFTYNNASVTYGTVLNPTTTKCWLDRNLGADQVATSSTDSLAYGDLFQWGRPADGHQNTSSVTIITLSSSDTPNHNKFILAPFNPYDWRSDNNSNRWNASPIVNNPCPTGFRVPTLTELIAEKNSWGSQQNSAGAFASPLKLTVAGYRSNGDGSLSDVGSGGSYWLSTAYYAASKYLYFDSVHVDIANYHYRAFGLSVRCIKD